MRRMNVNLIQMDNTSSEIVQTDVEDLVVALQHNLRLKSRPCHLVCSKQKRMSPYRIPTKTSSKQSYGSTASPDPIHEVCRTKIKKTGTTDPYQLLQELLNEGSLVKEAVRRLQLGLHSSARTKCVNYYDCEFDRSCSH